MGLMAVRSDRVAEAADLLSRAMLEDPGARFILPDPAERLAVFREIYVGLVERALDEGRVDAWGHPIVGVAIWLRRPALDDVEPASPAPEPSRRPHDVLPPDAALRAGRFASVMGRLRELARPDRHAYLDTIGVLSDHRRHGIATCLLDAGHAWADAAGLPCALDTLTHENVEFYERRGYRVVAAAPVPGSDLRITAMRREGPATPRSDADL